MNKIYALPPREDWIVDRFVSEWNEDNSDISTDDPRQADIIWLLGDWCWDTLYNNGTIQNKKVLTTVHHIVPEKFGQREIHDFLLRDKFTTAYHVYNEQTYKFIEPLTTKKIYQLPYWANQKIWKRTDTKENIRKKYNIPLDRYVIGSFQRDTEGKDLISPKLEKGPDLLADYLESIKHKNPFVILAGWRRQYISKRLKDSNIEFIYIERPPHSVVNELYQSLDLYPVASRCEGGPQSLLECGLLKVPVVSRDVGIARQVLDDVSINSDLTSATPGIPNVDSLKLPHGYEPYRKLLLSL